MYIKGINDIIQSQITPFKLKSPQPQPALAAHSPKANPPIAATKTAARMPVPLMLTLSAELAPMFGPAETKFVESDPVADGAAAPVDNVTGSVELLREVAE